MPAVPAVPPPKIRSRRKGSAGAIRIGDSHVRGPVGGRGIPIAEPFGDYAVTTGRIPGVVHRLGASRTEQQCGNAE